MCCFSITPVARKVVLQLRVEFSGHKPMATRTFLLNQDLETRGRQSQVEWGAACAKVRGIPAFEGMIPAEAVITAKAGIQIVVARDGWIPARASPCPPTTATSAISPQPQSVDVIQHLLLEGFQTEFAGLVVRNDRFLNRQNLPLRSIARIIAEPAVSFVNDDEVHILTRLDHGQ